MLLFGAKQLSPKAPQNTDKDFKYVHDYPSPLGSFLFHHTKIYFLIMIGPLTWNLPKSLDNYFTRQLWLVSNQAQLGG